MSWGCLLLLLAVQSATAHADSADIGDECRALRGARYEECNGPGFTDVVCVPNRCQTDADCGDTATCQELQACIDPNGSCGGTSEKTDPIEALLGECDAEQKCGGDAICQPERVCVQRTLEHDDSGCAVSAPGRRRSTVWVWGLLAYALLILVRSKRRTSVVGSSIDAPTL